MYKTILRWQCYEMDAARAEKGHLTFLYTFSLHSHRSARCCYKPTWLCSSVCWTFGKGTFRNQVSLFWWCTDSLFCFIGHRYHHLMKWYLLLFGTDCLFIVSILWPIYHFFINISLLVEVIKLWFYSWLDALVLGSFSFLVSELCSVKIIWFSL